MTNNQEFKDFVNKVRESSDIFSVISRYLTLNKKGNQYWACCPFHNEKTPSFTVSPEKGFFYCFGCHAGGNVFKFISMIENISYFDAVKLQAERLGIELPHKKNKTPEQLQKENEEKLLIKINTMAKDFFHNCLVMTTYGEAGRKYLESRGINKETIEEFSLGFAPNSWNALTNALIKKKNMQPAQLLASGLSSKRKNGSGIYDKFRNRVMIPIADLFGNVVAFGGRVLPEEYVKEKDYPDYDPPKYLNSPETLIFNKKNLLFGLNKATQEIRKSGYVIIVEGYMDVISVFSAGIKNVVASLGTAFTNEQAKLLTKYTRKVIFCYDSDEAGQNATMRALPIVMNEGIDAKVITIPDGKDPDEYIRKHGAAAFRNLISKAVSTIDYRLNYVLSHNEYSSLEGKISALHKMLPALKYIKDLTRQSEYCKRIASVLLINEDVVSAELNKFKPDSNINKPAIRKDIVAEDNKILAAGRIILKMAWIATDTILYTSAAIPKEAFAPVHQEIIEYLQKCMKEQRSPDDLSASEELSEQAAAEVSKILLENGNNSDKEAMKGYSDSIDVLKLNLLRVRYNKLMAEIKEISTGTDYTKKPDYIEKLKLSQKIKKEMDKLKLV